MRKNCVILSLLLSTVLIAPLLSQNQGYFAGSSPTSLNNPYYEGYQMGEMAAGNGIWWGVGSFVAGCCLGGIVPIDYGLLIPVASAVGGCIPLAFAAINNPKPSMYLIRHDNPDYSMGYSEGYAKAQKKNNIISAAVGTGASVAVAFGAMILVANAYYDDDYDDYKADLT